ncbi:hypothetical protein Golob_003853, partial [Gossypium lobatum]|nr:hypothetical protein [Gossypium lobatum]
RSFAKNVGTCSVVDAELWGVLEGPQQVWKIGGRKVFLETDSMVVTRLLKAQQIGNADTALVRAIKRMLRLDWIVEETMFIEKKIRLLQLWLSHNR